MTEKTSPLISYMSPNPSCSATFIIVITQTVYTGRLHEFMSTILGHVSYVTI